MTTEAMTALGDIDAEFFKIMGLDEPREMTIDELAQGVVDYLAEQAAPDTRPDHIGTLVRAILDGGVDAAIYEFDGMTDIRSDAERETLLARAEFIVSGMRVLARGAQQ